MLFIIIAMAYFFNHQVLANDIQTSENSFYNYFEATGERKAVQLCESFIHHTKHGTFTDIRVWTRAFLDNTPINEDMRNALQIWNIREGLREWAFIRSHAFVSAFSSITIIGIPFPGDHQPRGAIPITTLLTSYSTTLVNSDKFDRGIHSCATRNGIEDENLEAFTNYIKELILGTDKVSSITGIATGLAVDFYMFRGIGLAWNFFKSFRFYRWLSNTAVIGALRDRFSFLIRHRAKLIGGTIAVGMVSAIGYEYYRIHKEHTGRPNRANLTTLITEIEPITQENTIWSIRLGQYQTNIINNLGQAERAIPGSVQHDQLQHKVSVYLDHYLKDYWVIEQRLDELRRALSNFTDENFESQEAFLTEIFEYLTVRKLELEREFAQLQPTQLNPSTQNCYEGYDQYDRYDHLKILFEIMEINRNTNYDEKNEQWAELQRNHICYRDMRLSHSAS